MTEAARTLAFVATFLMLISIGIWAKWLRGPLLQRLDGQRASNAEPGALAIQVLMVAFGVSALAAALAIVGWIVL